MKPPSGAKTICLPFESEAHYQDCVAKPAMYRESLHKISSQHAELVPAGFSHGFDWHDSYTSRKQKLQLRRIKLTTTGAVYSVRPSFVRPYLVARTAEVEKALYLRQFGVPFDALASGFGRDPMFW